jgi:hypothetical protein
MTSARALIVVGLALAVLVGVRATPSSETRQSAPDVDGVPSFIQVNRCYQFAVQTPVVTRYRVLAHLDDGWISAESDVGTSPAQRDRVWINTTQIISAREARCSD